MRTIVRDSRHKHYINNGGVQTEVRRVASVLATRVSAGQCCAISLVYHSDAERQKRSMQCIFFVYSSVVADL